LTALSASVSPRPDEDQRRVESVGRQRARRLLDVVLAAIHRRVRPQAAHQLHAVGPRGDRQDARAHALGQLHGQVSDPTAGPEHGQRLARRQPQLVLEPAQRGDAVGSQRPGLVGPQAGRYGRHIVLVDRHVLCVEAPIHREGIDRIAHLEPRDVGANRHHHARAVVADDARKIGLGL